MYESDEEVEVVIKIPKEEYDICKRTWDTDCLDVLMSAVKYGTLLPKGHGKIVDVNEILLDATTITTDDYSGNEVLDVVLKEDIDNVHAIIEADEVKENSEELEEDIER